MTEELLRNVHAGGGFLLCHSTETADGQIGRTRLVWRRAQRSKCHCFVDVNTHTHTHKDPTVQCFHNEHGGLIPQENNTDDEQHAYQEWKWNDQIIRWVGVGLEITRVTRRPLLPGQKRGRKPSINVQACYIGWPYLSLWKRGHCRGGGGRVG